MQEIYLVTPILYINDHNSGGEDIHYGEQSSFISFEDATIEANRIKNVYDDLLSHSPVEKKYIFDELDSGKIGYPFFSSGVVMDLLQDNGYIQVDVKPIKIYPIGTVL